MQDSEQQIEEVRKAVKGMIVFQGALVRRLLVQDALTKGDVAHALGDSSGHFQGAGELQELWGQAMARAML